VALTVVTACDKKFAPGAIALRNSVVRNTPKGEIEFYTLAFGDEQFCSTIPGRVIANPKYPKGQHFPKGGRWDEGVIPHYPKGLNPSLHAMPAMYARLLLPEIFQHKDRVLWVDADCLVLDSLAALIDFDFDGHCMASVDVSQNIHGNFKSLKQKDGNSLGFRAPGTGTMLINVPVWREKRITEKCFDLMNAAKPGDWLSVVQSGIILAVEGDFAEYGSEYMCDVKRKDPPAGTKICHFTIVLPWCEKDLATKPSSMAAQCRKIWEPYR